MRESIRRSENCPFDPNVELQLTREPRHAAPRTTPAMGRKTFDWSDLPQRPAGYVAPLILGGPYTPPWPRLDEHSRLVEWSGWQISGYGTQVGDRIVFCAMPPGETSWRFYADLDRGEWQAWGGAWQPLNHDPTVTAAAAPAPARDPAVDELLGHLCQRGEYPDPSTEWSVDQLRGWRTVRDRDGTVCGHFGPDRQEDKQKWQTWLIRIQAFASGLGVQV